MDAREATRATGTGGSGVMVPPSAHEWGQPLRARAMDLPAFGHGTSGDVHREDVGEAECLPRESGEQGVGGETNLPPYIRVKQEDDYTTSPLDDYFCNGMSTSGPASWAKVLREMAMGELPDVGALNAQEGVREEKWISFNLRTVKFPSTQTSSVRRATPDPEL